MLLKNQYCFKSIRPRNYNQISYNRLSVTGWLQPLNVIITARFHKIFNGLSIELILFGAEDSICSIKFHNLTFFVCYANAPSFID